MTARPSLSAPSSRNGFFTTLPRELRDNIYDRLCKELDVDVWDIRYQAYTICNEFRLVSRQFKLEYDERTSTEKHFNHLTINIDLTSSHWCDAGIKWPSRQLAARTTVLTVNMIFCNGQHGPSPECGAAEPEIMCYQVPIDEFAWGLPSLRTFHLRLHSSSILCVLDFFHYIDDLTALPKLTKLTILKPHPTKCFTTCPDSLAVWTRQDGLHIDQEAIEQHRRLEYG